MAFPDKGKCCIALCWALWLLPVFSNAQQRGYSLSSLMDSAHHYLPAIQQKKALVNAAQARIKDTRHSFLPQVRLSEQMNIGSDNSLAGIYYSMGIVPSTSAGIREQNDMQAAAGNLAAVYAEYDIYNFGLNKARLQNADAYAGLQQTDMQREIYMVDVEIARTYLHLLRNISRLNTDKQNVDRYQQIYTVIRALAESGLVAGADSSLALAELSRARINCNMTQDKVDQFKEQLAYYTGISSSRLQVDTFSFSMAGNYIPAAPHADTVNNPFIDYYKQQVAVFSTADKVIGRSYMPRLTAVSTLWARGSSIGYGDQYHDLQTGLNYQRYNYVFGLALTYNLFGELYKHDKQLINRYQWDAARFELQQQQLASSSQMNTANKAVTNAMASLKEMPVQLHAAEATFAQKTAQYKAGLISLVDLTNASFVLYRSQMDYIEAAANLYLALLDKAATTGDLNSFVQTINW